jgi:hypothetical protein
VCHGNVVAARAMVMQQKTQRRSASANSGADRPNAVSGARIWIPFGGRSMRMHGEIYVLCNFRRIRRHLDAIKSPNTMT